MVKNLCLFIALSLLPSMALTSNVGTQQAHTITQFIYDAKKDIMFEVKTALLLKDKAEQHFKNRFPDTYQAVRQKSLQVLKNIASSEEFSSTLEQVTDEQAQLIARDLVPYNDLSIDSSAYPLAQKVEKELSLAALNKEEKQAFNIFYLVFTILKGSQILITKLESIEKELYTQHHNTAALDQTPHA